MVWHGCRGQRETGLTSDPMNIRQKSGWTWGALSIRKGFCMPGTSCLSYRKMLLQWRLSNTGITPTWRTSVLTQSNMDSGKARMCASHAVNETFEEVLAGPFEVYPTEQSRSKQMGICNKFWPEFCLRPWQCSMWCPAPDTAQPIPVVSPPPQLLRTPS